ncbi:MAG: hypothetical protein IKK46_04070 [Clostridia bacterium]|nr:hypothetical protein [Clostridia bacterium]MBR3809460.1 hypothetical protein [Clostridia bacterium]
MLELDNALNLIIKGLESTTKELGFKVVYPDGVRPPEAPVFKENNSSYISYTGEKGRIRIVFKKNQLALHCATVDEEDTPDDDMKRISLSLLELEEYEEKDLSYIYEEFTESLLNTFKSKHDLRGNVKMPTPVSKSKAKNGVQYFDAVTLGNKMGSIYPELKEEYKNNITEYGEFLPEEFFVTHGNKFIEETIRQNDKQKMRKLFNILNEIYDDGTNDTQSLIGVTILGTILSENPDLLPNAESYFGDVMREPVTEIIKYLSSPRSKGAKMRLKNPPIYKPKAKKKKGFMQEMMGM